MFIEHNHRSIDETKEIITMMQAKEIKEQVTFNKQIFKGKWNEHAYKGVDSQFVQRRIMN